jgi:hypothetical protein
MAHKTPKGEISINRHRGSRLRLRWRLNGKRYELPANAYTHENLKLAAEVAGRIKKDILAGDFDATLARYERMLSPAPHYTGHLATLGDLCHLYTEWVTTVRSAELEVTVYYLSVLQLLRANSSVPVAELPALLSRHRWSSSTNM